VTSLSLPPGSPCVLCGQLATASIDPPRRTLERGADPSDQSYSVTVILPDVLLCTDDGLRVRQGDLLVGWCDDEDCRTYGEVGKASACGHDYEKLATGKPSK